MSVYCIIILVINKLDSRFTFVQFRNHLYDYRLNWTPISPITIITDEFTDVDDDDEGDDDNGADDKLLHNWSAT